jgi:hypothetical protein
MSGKIWDNEKTEEFVTIWIKAVKDGHNTEYVARKLNCTASQLSNRASYLRKLGVNLPRLNPGMPLRTKLLEKANQKINETLAEL